MVLVKPLSLTDFNVSKVHLLYFESTGLTKYFSKGSVWNHGGRSRMKDNFPITTFCAPRAHNVTIVNTEPMDGWWTSGWFITANGPHCYNRIWFFFNVSLQPLILAFQNLRDYLWRAPRSLMGTMYLSFLFFLSHLTLLTWVASDPLALKVANKLIFYYIKSAWPPLTVIIIATALEKWEKGIQVLTIYFLRNGKVNEENENQIQRPEAWERTRWVHQLSTQSGFKKYWLNWCVKTSSVKTGRDPD